MKTTHKQRLWVIYQRLEKDITWLSENLAANQNVMTGEEQQIERYTIMRLMDLQCRLQNKWNRLGEK